MISWRGRAGRGENMKASTVSNYAKLAFSVLLVSTAFAVAKLPAVNYRAEKGIAMAVTELSDLDRLGAGWYFQWGENCADARCIPMGRSMQVPKACYPILLVGNEPNAIEPYGA